MPNIGNRAVDSDGAINRQELNPDGLYQKLAECADDLDMTEAWPTEQLQTCADYGVFKWFVGQRWGGLESTSECQLQGFIRLAEACMTTAFVISQRTAAGNRIASSHNKELADRLLPDLATGKIFVTLGISHLTTSRQHLAQPMLQARRIDNGPWQLDGMTPWVTGGPFADYLVVGAATCEGQQILFALPTSLPGLKFEPALKLVALTASHTASIQFHSVMVADEYVLSGPCENVLQAGQQIATGGLPTSALAIGLSSAAVKFVQGQSFHRPNLTANATALGTGLEHLQQSLLSLARGDNQMTGESLRAAANHFVLRATQSALIAAKGSGFVAGHPVGRWCREAMFFLVWSCPHGVSHVNLCQLAGLTPAD